MNALHRLNIPATIEVYDSVAGFDLVDALKAPYEETVFLRYVPCNPLDHDVFSKFFRFESRLRRVRGVSRRFVRLALEWNKSN